VRSGSCKLEDFPELLLVIEETESRVDGRTGEVALGGDAVGERFCGVFALSIAD
jgi:hypothetical protein